MEGRGRGGWWSENLVLQSRSCLPVRGQPRKEGCGLAVELIEFRNLPPVPADTKCLARREASQEANRMARPRPGTAGSLSFYDSWLKIACLLAPQLRAPTGKAGRSVPSLRYRLPSAPRRSRRPASALPARSHRGLTCEEGLLTT